jgi:juvenile hormone epoxide hydrolase
LGDYWLKKYDWRKQEKMLNGFPQFMTTIDGVDVHFMHVKPDPVKSAGKTVLPLLMGHGWPGSVVEFVKILPMLTTPRLATSLDFII